MCEEGRVLRGGTEEMGQGARKSLPSISETREGGGGDRGQLHNQRPAQNEARPAPTLPAPQESRDSLTSISPSTQGQ